jgi:hypothetical protein
MIRAGLCCLGARYRHAPAAAAATNAAAIPATSGRGKRRWARRSTRTSSIGSGRRGATDACGMPTGAVRTAGRGAGRAPRLGADATGSAACAGAGAGRSPPRDFGADTAASPEAAPRVVGSTARMRGGACGRSRVRASGCNGARRGSTTAGGSTGGASAGGAITTGAGGGGGAGAALGTGSGVGGSPGGDCCTGGGKKRSGSTYPSGSAARRTPRCTYGTGCSDTPLEPTEATASPSPTSAPRPTDTEPRWSRVTE